MGEGREKREGKREAVVYCHTRRGSTVVWVETMRDATQQKFVYVPDTVILQEN